MAFYGCEFTFDDYPCYEHGLMIYDFDSITQGDAPFQAGEIIGEQINNRYDTFMYGFVQNKPLEFTLIFGANPHSMSANESLDRYEMEAIATWLTGHKTWKWLSIVQDDMENYRYKCLITELKPITYGNMPWAFSCKVTCDSPFAYTYPLKYEYKVNGSKEINFFNRSTYNGFYMPNMEIVSQGVGNFSIINHSDDNRVFSFNSLPSGENLTISVDNKNQVIKNNIGVNLYPNFNFNFFRLVRGDNILTIDGNGVVRFICEFPINVGG